MNKKIVKVGKYLMYMNYLRAPEIACSAVKTKTNLFILLILFLSCNLDLNSKSILYQKSSMSFVDDTVAVKIKSKNYSAEQTYTKEDGESFTAAREVNIIKLN